MRSTSAAKYLLFALGVPWASPAGAAVYFIAPDGSGDFPTIQSAIDAATDGDIVELGDGTYTGAGNREISYLGKAITVRSQSGDPALCIIDCQASASDEAHGFLFDSFEPPTAVLQGITVTHGYIPPG